MKQSELQAYLLKRSQELEIEIKGETPKGCIIISAKVRMILEISNWIRDNWKN